MNTAVRIEQLEAEVAALKAANDAQRLLLEGRDQEIERLTARAGSGVVSPSVATDQRVSAHSPSVADAHESATLAAALPILERLRHDQAGELLCVCRDVEFGPTECLAGLAERFLETYEKAAAILPSGGGATGAATSDAGPVHGSPPLVPTEPQS